MSSTSTPLKHADQCLSSSNDSTASSEDLKHQSDIIEFVEGDSCGHTENVLAQDHVILESNTDEEDLSHQFNALSALLPNLTKMDDMPSVLEEAISYINRLDGQVKELERLSEINKADAHESDISIYTSEGTTDVACSSHKTNSTEIEVKIVEKSVLVQIKCEKNSSSLINALEEMLKSGLIVTGVNTMPIANTIIFIKIIAEMSDGIYMTPTDLLKNLQQVERNTNEDLSHLFSSLSVLLHNPTKMDDTSSLLEEAISYINRLDGQVKELERLSEINKADAHESDIHVNTSQGPTVVTCSSHKTNSTEIEVKIVEKSVLVRIKCDRNLSSLVNALKEMLKSNMCVTNVNTMPFANTTMFIDIIAEMSDDNYMTPTDLLKNLQQVL